MHQQSNNQEHTNTLLNDRSAFIVYMKLKAIKSIGV